MIVNFISLNNLNWIEVIDLRLFLYCIFNTLTALKIKFNNPFCTRIKKDSNSKQKPDCT